MEILLAAWAAGALVTFLVVLEMLLGAFLGSFQKSKSDDLRREDRLFTGLLIFAVVTWPIAVPYFFYRRHKKNEAAE